MCSRTDVPPSAHVHNAIAVLGHTGTKIYIRTTVSLPSRSNASCGILWISCMSVWAKSTGSRSLRGTLWWVPGRRVCVCQVWRIAMCTFGGWCVNMCWIVGWGFSKVCICGWCIVNAVLVGDVLLCVVLVGGILLCIVLVGGVFIVPPVLGRDVMTCYSDMRCIALCHATHQPRRWSLQRICSLWRIIPFSASHHTHAS